MKFKLRPYQTAASDSAFNEWNGGSTATGIILPTGCGKTIVFSDIIRRMHPKRTMVLAHRKELIWQAREKIMDSTGLTVDIEMGDYKAANNGLFKRDSVVVSTVQTHTSGNDGMGRMGKFDPMDFGLLVIDEMHHAVSASFRRVINYYRQNPDLKILGVTATPDRADEEALGQVFDTVAFKYQIIDAIEDGWLVPVEQQMVSVSGLDFSKVRTSGDDFNSADLDAIMQAEKILHGVTSPTIDIIGDKRAVVFTASVEHARKMCEIFNRHKTGMSAWISGKTDPDERKKILSDAKSGKIQILCNCNVLTEGWDDFGIHYVIQAKPMKSRLMYEQTIGRGTRPLPNVVDGPTTKMGRRLAILRSEKPSCTVIDFHGNSGKHKLITVADILGGNVSEDAIETIIATAKRTGKPMRVDQVLVDEEALAKERETKRLAAEAKRAGLIAKASFKTSSVNPFDVLEIRNVSTKQWDAGKKLSEGQSAALRRCGIDPNKITYGQGKQLLAVMGERRKKNLSSFGQMKTLKKYNIDATEMSFEHASKTIDSIAQNGWRLPRNLPAEPRKHRPPPVIVPKLNSVPVSIEKAIQDDIPF